MTDKLEKFTRNQVEQILDKNHNTWIEIDAELGELDNKECKYWNLKAGQKYFIHETKYKDDSFEIISSKVLHHFEYLGESESIWIEATQENVEKYFFDGDDFSKKKLSGYIFYAGADLVSDKCICFSFYEKVLEYYYFDSSEDDEIYERVTHFAPRSDFEKLIKLPKPQEK